MGISRNHDPSSTRVAPAIIALTLLALAVRILYFAWTRHIYGDAVQFSLIAKSLAEHGASGYVDPSWHQFFCFWQAPFQVLVPHQAWASALSSIIPGAALLIPVFLIGHHLGGRPVGVIASLFCALHPNLVNYSCNGYMESFYIFWFALAAWFLTLLFAKARLAAAIGAGVSMGVAFATRNEFLAFIAATLFVIPVLRVPWLCRWFGDSGEAFLALSKRRFALLWLGIAGGAALTVAAYSSASHALADTSGLFQKAGNLSRTHDIFKDREAAAREIYGSDNAPPSGGSVVSATLARVGKNLTVSLPDTLPRLLASPLYIFALVPFLAWFGKRRLRLESLPLLMMLAFTPTLYAFLFIQPRYLQPTLPPLHIVSAMGIMMLAAKKPDRRPLLIAISALFIGLLVATTIWRGSRLRQQAVVHHETADWIREHVPQEATLVGCGFGYVSDTAFLTGNPTLPRIVTDDPVALAPFVRKQDAEWLVLYEEFIRDANVELFDALDAGVPGFEKVHTTRASHIYRLLP